MTRGWGRESEMRGWRDNGVGGMTERCGVENEVRARGLP